MKFTDYADISYIENVNITCVGTEKPRSYYVPFPKREESFNPCQTSSSLYNLNGEWAFKVFESLEEVDIDETYENRIKVPSCVQMQGYDSQVYSGCKYPFPVDPPYIPIHNPAFCYRTFYNNNINDGIKKYMVFEGVDSAFYLFINKKFVGYSSMSHSMSEFDITSYLTLSQNIIDVVVLKWNKGSYLEDQDKWRMSGIFRNCYILTRPFEHIGDYKITTDCDGNLTVFNLYGADISIEFEGQINLISSGENCTFSVKNPKLWSAEMPTLYPCILSSCGEYICEQVGFREAVRKNKIFLFNGKPIKFRGVNRHDFSCNNGFSVTEEEMETDIRLMKQHNINAVRTSHYPNSPIFYKLCDKYGMYVMDECDIECHGMSLMNTDYCLKDCAILSDNPLWESQYIHRIESMYERDKNRPCVIAWSLGNESGWGRNFRSAIRYLKGKDTRLLHYEGIFEIAGSDEYYSSGLDFISRMYPEISYLEDAYINDSRINLPLVLCEYSHSMGNSAGDYKDYWDIINSHEEMCGAFVWEWCDHGIKTEKGFCYGGDFGDKIGDKNYCIDGLISSDRKVKSALKELSSVLCQIKVREEEYGQFTVYNHYDFQSLDEVECKVYIVNDNKRQLYAELDLSDIPPCAHKSFCFDKISDVLNGEFFSGIEFIFFSKKSFLQQNILLKKCFTLYEKTPKLEKSLSKVNVVSFSKLQITVDEALFEINKKSGTLDKIQIGDRKLLLSPIKLNIYRAPLDNDRPYLERWSKAGYDDAEQQARRITVDNNVVEIEGSMVHQSKVPIIKFTLFYRFYRKLIEIKVIADIDECLPFLPRFGLEFVVPIEYAQYEYLGFDGESYIDKHQSCSRGYYEKNVFTDYEGYLKPQECGSHFDTDYLKVDNLLEVTSDKKYSFSILPYSRIELTGTEHDWELPQSSGIHISLDHGMSGVGSASCGPQMSDKYRLNEKHIERTFLLKLK